MNPIINLARPEIIALQPYSSARGEVGLEGIWLNANENPFVLNKMNPLNRYPEQQPESLIDPLRLILNIQASQLLITRGSDEGIDLLIRAFCKANEDKVIVCPPTYGMYAIASTIQGAGILEVPLLKEKGFALNEQEILHQAAKKVKIIFMCSPNNPTGNLLEVRSILNICKELENKAIIVVDEAYIDFAHVQSLTEQINHYSNLVILRTLSKAYGLAGARCGMVIAHPDIILLLKKIIAPYPIATPVIKEINNFLNLNYQEKINEQINLLENEKEKLIFFLKNLPKVKKIWPSVANFLLVEVDDVAVWLRHCFAQGIAIRDRSNMLNLEHCLRISIGIPEENQKLMETLNNV
jgi:histidinol-phosphate aminotransferase